jgi:hypothetical protein
MAAPAQRIIVRDKPGGSVIKMRLVDDRERPDSLFCHSLWDPHDPIVSFDGSVVFERPVST